MECIRSLYSENDYDVLTVKLVDKKCVSVIQSLFPGYNPKMLLSSFILVKFHADFGVCEPLLTYARVVMDSLVNNNSHDLDGIYEKYKNEFNIWKSNDINQLKNMITETRNSYSKMLEEEIRDEADQAWYDGVKGSIDMMNKKLHSLDEYSKNPPS